jgi:hypothetical protein
MRRFLFQYWQALKVPAIPVVWAVMVLIGTVAGPFGTFEAFGPLARVLYWAVLVAAAVLVGALGRVMTQEYLGQRRYLSEAPLIALIAVALLTLPFWWITELFVGPDLASHISIETMALYILCGSVSVTTLRYAFGRPGEPPSALPEAPETSDRLAAETVAPPPEPPLGPRLLARLAPAHRAPLWRMQVRDHYVDVVTEAGSESLLMRFGDAMAEADGTEGLQVHRSHWVARAAIAGVRREKGRLALRMHDGAEVPVSRTYQPQVEVLLPDLALSEAPPAASAPEVRLPEAAQ